MRGCASYDAGSPRSRDGVADEPRPSPRMACGKRGIAHSHRYRQVQRRRSANRHQVVRKLACAGSRIVRASCTEWSLITRTVTSHHFKRQVATWLRGLSIAVLVCRPRLSGGLAVGVGALPLNRQRAVCDSADSVPMDAPDEGFSDRPTEGNPAHAWRHGLQIKPYLTSDGPMRAFGGRTDPRGRAVQWPTPLAVSPQPRGTGTHPEMTCQALISHASSRICDPCIRSWRIARVDSGQSYGLASSLGVPKPPVTLPTGQRRRTEMFVSRS